MSPVVQVDSTIVVGPQAGRRRRFTASEKRRLLDEAVRSGESISSVGRRYGLSVSLLFRWRRQLQGAPAPRVARLAPVEKRDELERLREQIRDLQRLLGKKTLENEALRESLRGAQSGNVENVHALAPNGGGPSPLVRDGSA